MTERVDEEDGPKVCVACCGKRVVDHRKTKEKEDARW